MTRQFEFLHSIDIPTACNLIEVVTPNRHGFGYTVKHLHCPFPDLPPIVGYAKTVKIKSKDPFKANSSGYMAKRLDYLDYVAAEPRPSISVIEDTDGEYVGYGAFWGEVRTNVHKALGVLGQPHVPDRQPDEDRAILADIRAIIPRADDPGGPRQRWFKLRRKSVQKVSASDGPTHKPMISRRPSVLTAMAIMAATEMILPPWRTLR